MGQINKATLQSSYQSVGDIYQDTDTEACFEMIADAHNETDAALTAALAPGATGTERIADQAVTQSKIAIGAVGPNQLQTGLAATVDVNAQFAKRGIDVTSAPYFAKGDGVTDDTAAIQAAITALPATGGKIILPGVFRITSALVITKPVILEGAGHSTNIGTANYSASVIIKDGNFDAITLKSGGSIIRDISVIGTSGNGGDGIVMAAARCTIEHVFVASHGGNGVRIGDAAGDNCNLWRIIDLITISNAGHGLYIHDPKSATLPDANSGTLVGIDARANGGDGIRIQYAIDCDFYGVTCQTNTGYGVHLMSGAKGHKFFGPYTEANTSGEFILDSGADQNMSLGYRSGVAGDGYTNNGAGNLILCNDAQQAGNPPYFKSGFSAKSVTITDNTVPGVWTAKQQADKSLLIQLSGTGSTPVNAKVGHAAGSVNWQVDTLQIGGGALISKHLWGLGSLDFPSIPANSTVTLDLNCAGAAVGDSCYAMPNGEPEAGLIWSAYVAVAGSVRIRLANVTTAPIDPASRGWRVDVWQH